MQTYDFQLKVKALEDAGTFTGYASTYGPPADYYGDILAPGAFTRTIQNQGKGFPLLWSHDQATPIGLARVSDSREGLVVDGKLLLSDPAGQRALDHLRMESIRGLSIGFDVPSGEGKVSYSSDGTRTLKEVRLHEISLVACPANPNARVVNVKSLGDVRHVLNALRDGDVTDDALGDLLEIDRELKRLLIGRDPQEAKAAALRELQEFADSLKKLTA